MAQVFADDDADGTGGAAGGEPVSPTDDEAGEIADGTAGEIVLAATARDDCTQFGNLESGNEGVKSSAKPDCEVQPNVGKASCNVTGSANDADGDRVADGDGHAEADAENLQKFAAIWGFSRRVGGGVGGQGVVSGRTSYVCRRILGSGGGESSRVKS